MFEKLKAFFTKSPPKPVLASRSPKWSELRAMWLSQQPICQGCGTEKNLQVHHIIPVHVDPSRELDSTNLITLCEQVRHDCHFHIGHLLNWKAYNPTCIENAKSFKTAIEQRPYSQPPPPLPPPSPSPSPQVPPTPPEGE